MPKNTNFTVINNYDSYQTITLGDVSKDQVYDYSYGHNTITLGQGAADLVYSNSPFDTISLGGGKADSVVLAFSSDPGNGSESSTVTLGDGADDQVYDGGFGANVISLGNGAGDTVTDYSSHGDLISVGNGAKDTVYDYGRSEDIIQTGTGANDTVFLDTGDLSFSVVTFGGPSATLNLSFAVGPSPALPATGGLDIISGLVKGDHIVLSGGALNTDTLATSASLGGEANEAVLTPGTYNSGTQTFTAGAGSDAMLTYDTQGFGGGYISVVLVGAAHEITGTTIHSGTITLG